MVVFGVTNRHGVAGREPQRLERHLQSSRLAHALWCCHHTAAVEDEHEWQFECPNDLEQAWSLVRVRIDQAPSGGKGNPEAAQGTSALTRGGRSAARGRGDGERSPMSGIERTGLASATWTALSVGRSS